MSRNVASIAVAFALLVGGAMLTSESSASAGHHGCGGGLFGHLRGNACAGPAVQRGCGGGLFSRLRARHQAACCAPAPVCCAPEPVCAPEPTCCAPAPVADCCAADGVYGGSVVNGHDAYQQQPGQVGGEAGVPSASDSVPPAPQADGASDAPPAPQPE